MFLARTTSVYGKQENLDPQNQGTLGIHKNPSIKPTRQLTSLVRLHKKPIKIILLTTCFLAVTACFSQSPAPIEYNNTIYSRPPVGTIEVRNHNLLDENSFKEPLNNEQKEHFTEVILAETGDSLSTIAQKYNISLRALVLANKNIRPNTHLYDGQEVIIPKIISHVILPKETIHDIAAKYNQSYQIIVQLNNLSPPYLLAPGKTLQVIISPIIHDQDTMLNALSVPNPQQVKLFKHGQLLMPAIGKIVNKFNPKLGARGEGIYIHSKVGEPVKAAASGEVIQVTFKPEIFGNVVVIKHQDNLYTAYANLGKILVQKNQYVAQSEIIGSIGSSMLTKGMPQMFFAVRRGKKPVDPLMFLPLEY